MLITYIYSRAILRKNMARVQSVSLDEKTARIASRLPNFSSFVRESLLRHAEEGYIHPKEDEPNVLDINYDKVEIEIAQPLRELVDELDAVVTRLENLSRSPDSMRQEIDSVVEKLRKMTE